MAGYRKYTKAEKQAWAKRMNAAKAAKAKAPTTSYPKRTYTKKTYTKKNTDVNPGLNMLARTGGSFLGNLVAPGIGGVIGGGLADAGHRLFKTITGVGDYKVDSNTLMSDSVPIFNNSNRTVRVKHREFIGDVISGAANTFNIQAFPINPGLNNTFPWLANVAAQYEEYKIKGMIFEFKTMSADALNSTNTALGQVILATQYNVLSAAFASKQQMENYEFACSTKPSMSVIHPIECEPHETPLTELFVRNVNTTLLSNSDLRLYDFGNFYIATNGLQAANVNLGELWVSYDIEFFKPKILTVPVLQMADHWQMTNPSTSAYLGATQTLTSGSNLGSTLTANSFTIPSSFNGLVFMSYYVGGSVANTTAMTITTSAGISRQNLWINNSGSVVNPANSASQGGYLMNIIFRCSAGGTVTFSGATIPTSGNADLYLIAMPTTN